MCSHCTVWMHPLPLSPPPFLQLPHKRAVLLHETLSCGHAPPPPPLTHIVHAVAPHLVAHILDADAGTDGQVGVPSMRGRTEGQAQVVGVPSATHTRSEALPSPVPLSSPPCTPSRRPSIPACPLPPPPFCFTPDPDQECVDALVDAAHHELREHGAPDRGRRRERRKERGEGDHGLTLPIGTQTGALVQSVNVPPLNPLSPVCVYRSIGDPVLLGQCGWSVDDELLNGGVGGMERRGVLRFTIVRIGSMDGD